MRSSQFLRFLSISLFAAFLSVAGAKGTTDPVFNPAPKANNRKGWQIQNFGPVGIGIQLEQDFVMKILNVEPGSPADKTGQLEKGQIKPIGFTSQKYVFPMRYSGNMAFSTFIDKAYQYEVVTLGGREFLIMEWDFEPERDANFKTIYKCYVKVAGGK